MGDINSNPDDPNITGNHSRRRAGHAGRAQSPQFRHDYSISSGDSSFLPTPSISEHAAGQPQVYSENSHRSLITSRHPSPFQNVSTLYRPAQAGASTHHPMSFPTPVPPPQMVGSYQEPRAATNEIDWFQMTESQVAHLERQLQAATSQFTGHYAPNYQANQMPVSNTPHSPDVRDDRALHFPTFQHSQQVHQDAYLWPSASQSHYVSSQGPEPMQPRSEMSVGTDPAVIDHGQMLHISEFPQALFSNFISDPISRGEHYTNHGDHQAETNSNLLEADVHAHQLAVTSQFDGTIPSECFPQPLPAGTGTVAAAATSALSRSDSFVLGNPSDRFPNEPELQALARQILQQEWYIQNDPEPSLSSTDDLVTSGQLNASDSCFNLFHDSGGEHRCRWFGEDGKRCSHKSKRKDRATGHARAHFGYKPFTCSNKCGKKGCQEGYTVPSFLQDHINRKRRPTRHCDICQKVLTSQNLKRHMDNVHQGRVIVDPPESEQSSNTSKKKGGLFNKVRKVFKKARMKSPSKDS